MVFRIYYPHVKKFYSICETKIPVRSTLDAINQSNILSHIYAKPWTKKEIIQHIKENVVYECDDYIVTSLPQGISFNKNKKWIDYVNPYVYDIDVKILLKELPSIFNSELVFAAKYPNRNASGLTVFTRNIKACTYLKKNFSLARSHENPIFSFLVVVLGHPCATLKQTFGTKKINVEGYFGTEILQKWDKSKEIKKTLYQHEVLDSTELVSLVKVEVSCDSRDCVRHILASVCTTPVLGDIWNYKKLKSVIFGAPFVMYPSVKINNVELPPDLLAKLQLKSGEENVIPVHVHLYSMRIPLKKKKEFFASVPPTESFAWTCSQLGLNEINNFLKA